MPPEIINGKKQTDKVDIWCLGVLLYEMTHNNTPFEGQNIHMLQFQQRKHNITYKQNLNPQLHTIIEKCLEFDPEKRLNAEEILNFHIFSKYKQKNNSDQTIIKNNETSVNGDHNRRILNNNFTNSQANMVKTNANETPIFKNNAQFGRQQSKPEDFKQPVNTFSHTHHNSLSANYYKSQTLIQPNTERSLPLKMDLSSKNVTYQNAVFKKKQEPELNHADLPNETKVVKYNLTRNSDNNSNINDSRSASLTKNPNDNSLRQPYTNGTTVKVIRPGISGEPSENRYNRYPPHTQNERSYIQNLYTPPVSSNSNQINGTVNRQIINQKTEVNTSRTNFYNLQSNTVSQSNNNTYAPKVYKYSYNGPITEKINAPKMSYHVSNTGYPYANIYSNNGNGVERNNTQTVYIGEGTRNNTNQGNTPSDNYVTTRIIRHK